MNRRLWLQQSTAAAAGLLLAPTVRGQTSRPLLAHADATLFLDANENALGPSPRALEAMQRALREGNRYPDARPLVDAIATREGLTPEHVVLGHGSFELLCTAAIAFGGRDVVTPDPSFNVIASRVEHAGGRVHRVPLTPAWSLDLDAMDEAMTPETDLVYVCNPNNPTATIVPDRSLRPFCERASEHAIVIIDEAYHEYVESPAYASLVGLVQDGRDVVVLRTFSKAYGLAGMRIGYALARPDLAERLRAHSIGSLNVPGLAAAQAALDDRAFVTTSRRQNTEARTRLRAYLDTLGLYAADSHANFVWVDLGRPARPVYQALADQNVLIGRPGTAETPWVRISLGTPDEMDRFGSILTALL